MRRALGIGDHELVLLYFGHLGYAPNQEALQLLHRHVLPVLDRHGAEYRLLIAGRGSDELREQYNHPRMRFLGVVDRIEDAISAADAVVVPLVRGGGTRTKIIESIACAKPVVSTAAGAAGLDRSACGDLLTVVDGWDAFACATLAAARPGAPREVPASFRDVYAWSAIGRRIRFDDARTEAPLRSRGG